MLTLLVMNGAANTITVDDDNGGADYTSIQEAIQFSKAGDTIRVNDGTYYEDLTIDKQITIRGNGSMDTFIFGTGTAHTILINSKFVEFNGFCVSSRSTIYSAIFVTEWHVKIVDNKCVDSHKGTVFYYSSYGYSMNNTFLRNRGAGLEMRNSHNNTIRNCVSIDNYNGFELIFSNDNAISTCTLENNNRTTKSHGFSISSSHRNIIENCTISEYNGGADVGIFLIRSDGNVIDNCSVQDNNGSNAVKISRSTNNTILNCIFKNNNNGVSIGYSSHYNQIILCNFVNNANFAVNASSDGAQILSTENWWGSPSGPYHATMNPTGLGGNVTGMNISISPWSNNYMNNIPKIRIRSIEPNEILQGNIHIDGIAWDMDGKVEKIEISVDGGKWIQVNGTTFWQYDWNTTMVSDGRHTIMVRSWDGIEFSNIDEVRIVVDNQDDDSNTLIYLILIILLIVVTMVLLAVSIHLFGTETI